MVILQVSGVNVNGTGQVDTPKGPTSLTNPFYVRLIYGKIQELYIEEETNEENVEILNLKRSLASLIQYQPGGWEGWEDDVSGQCYVKYTVDHHGIEKSKTDCRAHSVDPSSSHREKVPLIIRVHGPFKSEFLFRFWTCQ